jgi:ABC-2 type transport system ATP-binding protein
MSKDLVIETNELTKSYGPHVALDKLSIQVEHGATGLLGPNGAGKSTFFKTILGLIQATSGEGKVLGHDIRTEGLDIRSKIGYMPEYDALDDNMDAIHQVRYSGELLGMNPVVAMSRAHTAMEYVGLGELRYRPISSFSTGMKQATKLACSIIHDPQLIIAESRQAMLTTLSNMVNSGNRSVLMASHLMDDVEQVCQNIVLLHKGKLAAQGRIEDLKAIDREIEIHVWGKSDQLELALGKEGLEVRREGRMFRIRHDGEHTTHRILKCAAETGAQIRRMHEYEASLEDLFIVIMERFGYAVKSSDDLLASPADARKVDAPESMGGSGA